ncbi:hypothetical protein V3472_01020 [Lacticaseibacillus rhamnosus]
MNGDQSQAQICEVYRYDRFLPRILLSGLMLLMVVMLVLWLFAIWKKSQFSLLLKCALTLLIVVLMLAAFYVILGILLFAVNTP